MKKTDLKINKIPAILWGEDSDRIFIAVHGNMSNKDDKVIELLAQEAIKKGYQVLSFDLPEHGERKNEKYPCSVQNCVSDLSKILDYAKTVSGNLNLFACSMGAYFSLLAYKDVQFEKCLFLSPVLNMERVINNMMAWFNVSEQRLKDEKVIETPIGQTLYWDYYSYVKANSITAWQSPTAILFGSDDNITEIDVVSDFVNRFNCDLQVLKHGEHYFHTEEQLNTYKLWLMDNINT